MEGASKVTCWDHMGMVEWIGVLWVRLIVVNLAEDILDAFGVSFNMDSRDRDNYCLELRETVTDYPEIMIIGKRLSSDGAPPCISILSVSSFATDEETLV